MIRFFLLAAIVWLVSKVAWLLYRSMSHSSQTKSQQQKYGSKQAQPPPQMDFKDVKDAEFEDLPEKEKARK